MNANELAKKIENYSYWSIIDFHYIKEAADMLRILDGQLAFRIDAVTKYQAKVEEQQAEIEALKAENSHLKYEISSGAWNPVPLTDEELSKVYEELYINYAGEDFPVDLGRAILRKAQEK
jgi:hypothetical protein